jgi:hypothetical protein
MQAEYGVDISTIDWQNTSPEQLQADYDLTDEELRDIVNEEAGKVFKFGQGPGFEALFGIRFP